MVAAPLLEEMSGSASGAMIAGLAGLPTEVRERAHIELMDGKRPPRRLAVYPASAGFDLVEELDHLCRRTVESYAYARVGYHRGLDALRKAGWRGQGPVPWAHVPNRGFLRSLYALQRAAAAIGEAEEVDRIGRFLNDSDPLAAAALEAE